MFNLKTILPTLILSSLLLASCSTGSAAPTTAPEPLQAATELTTQSLRYDRRAYPAVPEETPAPKSYTEREIELLAKVIFGEASVCTTEEQRLVAWTVFQRVDDDFHPDTIEEVITQPGQFNGYDEDNPIDEDIKELCVAEITDWLNGADPPTLAPYASSIPYYFFEGDGWHNWYRAEY